MTACETLGEPLECGNCVLQLLDEDDGKKVPPYTPYQCTRQDESCEEEEYAFGCTLLAYNDESGLTHVQDGQCRLVDDGLRDERFIDDSAERYWHAFRLRTFGIDVPVEGSEYIPDAI